MSYKKYLSILLKPTNACNMKCSFCYQKINSYSNFQSMSNETINIIADLFDEKTSRNINFQWIGGECFLKELDYYKNATEILSRASNDTVAINHCFQTNGSLIDERWCQYFKDNKNVSLSISFEVIPDIQNKYRPFIDTSSPPSYDVLTSNLDLLRYYNINFGVLSVITPEVIEIDAKKWLKEVFKVGVRSIGLQLCYQDSYWGSENTIGKYLEWLSDLFIAQSDHNNSVTHQSDCILIRESYYLYNTIIMEQPLIVSCHNNIKNCADYLFTIDATGSIFSYCDSFIGLKAESIDFCLGNIRDYSSFSEIFESKKYNDLKSTYDKFRRLCGDCKYHIICNGGCPLFKNFSIDNGVLSENKTNSSYCLLARGLLSYCLDIEKRNLIKSIYNYFRNDSIRPCSFFLTKI